MNILFVVAHPDDEVLGAGATIHKLAQQGHRVAVATLVNQAGARAHLSETLSSDQARAHEILGVEKNFAGDYPNIRMNTVPHLELVQFVESAREGIAPLRQLVYMEVLSSTEWSLDSSAHRFIPNLFVEVGEAGLDVKLRALEAYTGVMRPFPHPRSPEAIRGLAAYRGGQAGCCWAEAFEQVFSRM